MYMHGLEGALIGAVEAEGGANRHILDDFNVVLMRIDARSAAFRTRSQLVKKKKKKHSFEQLLVWYGFYYYFFSLNKLPKRAEKTPAGRRGFLLVPSQATAIPTSHQSTGFRFALSLAPQTRPPLDYQIAPLGSRSLAFAALCTWVSIYIRLDDLSPRKNTRKRGASSAICSLRVHGRGVGDVGRVGRLDGVVRGPRLPRAGHVERRAVVAVQALGVVREAHQLPRRRGDEGQADPDGEKSPLERRVVYLRGDEDRPPGDG